MIDTTKLQSSSLFAGFANLDTQLATISIPGNQTIPGFGTLTFFVDVPRPSNQSLAGVLFQVIGPTTIDGSSFDGNQWRSTISDFASWYQPDGANFEIDCDILRTSPGSLRLRVTYFNLQLGSLVYTPAVTVNAKVYFFKYPWE